MCGQHKGQKVVRTSNLLSGELVKGQVYTIKYLIDDKTLALEEVEGSFRRSEFADAETYVEPLDTDSLNIETLTAALRIIDAWNKIKPTGLMVSVTAYPAQDGGSVFETSTVDGNNIDNFVVELLQYATGLEKARILRDAATVMEQE